MKHSFKISFILLIFGELLMPGFGEVFVTTFGVRYHVLIHCY